MQKLGTILQELSQHQGEYLPEPDSIPVCATCRGAGFVSGAWQQSEGIDAKATSRGVSRERPYRPCPQCQHIKQDGPTVEEACKEIGALGEAVVSLEALQRGERWCVFMRGAVGVGKTYMATAFANALRSEGRRVASVVCCDLLDRLRETQSEASEEKLGDILSLYADADVLLLDDLGAERSTEWAIEQLFKIIDRRWTNKRTTIITSNMGAKEVDAKIGRRIYDRLRSSEVVINGKSRRT